MVNVPQFRNSLNDQDLIRRDDDQLGIGTLAAPEGKYLWSPVALRLTASGHKSAGALNDKKLFKTIKAVAHLGLPPMNTVAVEAAKLGPHHLNEGRRCSLLSRYFCAGQKK